MTPAAEIPVPDFPEFHAPASWQVIDFISDLHLADDTPRGLDAWAAYLANTCADAVFILGDLFEAWVGDDMRGEGFAARCVGVLRAASSQRSLSFMVGNRDFLVGGAMLRDCGVTALADPTVLIAFGQRVLLTHGDALCLDDVEYQRFRAQVRSPAWQAEFLRHPLAERRAAARHVRAESERRKLGEKHGGVWFDVETEAALRWMVAAHTPTLIHGHTHQPGSQVLAEGFTRHVLSDWELDHGPALRAEVLRWQASGFDRLAPADAVTTAR